MVKNCFIASDGGMIIPYDKVLGCELLGDILEVYVISRRSPWCFEDEDNILRFMDGFIAWLEGDL